MVLRFNLILLSDLNTEFLHVFSLCTETMQPPPGSVAMMQIDCEVTATKMVHIHKSDVPQHFQENSNNNNNNSTVSNTGEEKRGTEKNTNNNAGKDPWGSAGNNSWHWLCNLSLPSYIFGCKIP